MQEVKNSGPDEKYAQSGVRWRYLGAVAFNQLEHSSLIIMVERALTFYRCRFQGEQFINDLVPALQEADWPRAEALLSPVSGVPSPRRLDPVPHGKESAS